MESTTFKLTDYVISTVILEDNQVAQTCQMGVVKNRDYKDLEQPEEQCLIRRGFTLKINPAKPLFQSNSILRVKHWLMNAKVGCEGFSSYNTL